MLAKMARKVVFAVLSVLGIASCNSDIEIVYTYKDTVIRRIDKNGETTFYYDEINRDSPRIWAEYSGINDGFSGYLKFDESGKAIILSGDGYFQTANHDATKFDYSRIGAYQRPEQAENIYFIQSSIRYEQERNNGSVSKVKAVYPQTY